MCRSASSSCTDYSIFKAAWLLFAAAIGDALVTMRVLALYKGKAKIRVALKALYGVTYMGEFALICYYLDTNLRAKGIGNYAANLGCVITTPYSSWGPSNVLAIAAAPVLFLNLVMLVAVFANVLPPYLRYSRKTRTPLMTALIRDGAMYFVM